MKLRKRLALILAVVGLATGLGIVTDAPEAGATMQLIGSMPISASSTTSCWHDWATVQPDGSDHKVWCNDYDSGGNFIRNSVFVSFNFENCDSYQMVFTGIGTSYLDIWNGNFDPNLEFVEANGNRGGCSRGNWQSWTQGVKVNYPDATGYLHGAMLTTGGIGQQDVCGQHGLPSNQCPGVGVNVRFTWH